jgi:antitoxin component of MazEF toxin-antitoxin module
MTRQTITTVNNLPALILSADILDQLGVSIGEEVDITLVEQTLVMRSSAVAQREQRVEALIQSLLERRSQVYAALAEGPPS